MSLYLKKSSVFIPFSFKQGKHQSDYNSRRGMTESTSNEVCNT